MVYMKGRAPGDEVNPIAAGGKIASGEAEGFAEGAHLEGDSLLEAELFCETHSGEDQDAGCVGFVEEEVGEEVFADGYDFEGPGQRSPSMENTDSVATGCVSAGGRHGFLRGSLEFFDIVVGEDAEGGFRGAGCIDEAGVGESVEDDEITFPDDDRDGGERGRVAGGKGKGGLGVFSRRRWFPLTGHGERWCR